MENLDEIHAEPVEPGSRTRTPLIAACAVLAVIGCCCLLGAGVAVYTDPFDWNIVARLTGRYDAAAEAVPADAVAYIGIDLLQLRSADADRVFRAFAESDPDSTLSGPDAFLENLDREMEQEVGFNLSEDILPWVGQSAGIGFTDLPDGGGESGPAEFIFAATIRDRAAAEAFALLFRDRVEAASGETIRAEDYAGATIYSLPGFQGDGIAFAIHRGTFLLSADSSAIRASIDAKSAVSFMDTETFRALIRGLPRDAILTAFVTAGFFDELNASIREGMLETAAASSGLPFRSGAFSLAFVPEGIRIDSTLQYDPDALTELRRQQLQLASLAPVLDARVPANTLLYLRGRGLPLALDLLREGMEDDSLRAAFDESMASLDDELGFSLENDLLANLDGEYAVVLVPSSEGMLAAQDIDLGLGLLFETSNPAGLSPVLAGLSRLVENELGAAPRPVEVGGGEYFQVANPLLGELVAYGVLDDLFMITTSARTAADIVAGGPSLAAASGYDAAWQAFPQGFNPVLYADVDAMLGILREGMDANDLRMFDNEAGAVLAPIDFLAMGNLFPDPETQRTRLIVWITGGGE